MIKEIKLPEIADNVTTAIVLEILVSTGDKVEKDDSLAEMESDKATFELPSDFGGTVKDIKVSTGDEVKVGQVMFTIDTSAGGEEEKDEGKEEDKEDSKKAEEADEKPEPKEEDIKEDDEKEEVEKEEVEKEDKPEKKQEEKEKKDSGEKEMSSEHDDDKSQDQVVSAGKKQDTGKPASDIPAAPSVRRLARELGVDIRQVNASGPENRVTLEDVKAFTKKTMETRTTSGVADTYELPDFSKWGPVRREKLDTIRKITAKAMSDSWQSIPHVFQFDKADITDLESFRKKYSKQVEKEGAKLTFTAILLKITAEALKAFPRFNASIDMKNEEMIFKEFVNIGVAVDTERGLLVPVIRDADKKSITDLSIELNELAEKARNKKIMPDALQGGNFAISNLGGIGGTNFTPIVYRPNVAILGVSRSQTEPVYIDGEFKPRMMLPLSLSYDHRAIDGADGARFLRWLCEALENPLLAMFR
jgi:pyruvate dehydrogenase E2 component (dihydrolipoamide acetyltransferase)